MIISFVHKGLEKFFRNGSKKGIQAKHAPRLRLILAQLNQAETIKDLDFPGSGLHQLTGNLKGQWALKVSGNWRVTFKFENGEVTIVDYQDYH